MFAPNHGVPGQQAAPTDLEVSLRHMRLGTVDSTRTAMVTVCSAWEDAMKDLREHVQIEQEMMEKINKNKAKGSVMKKSKK